MQHIKASVDGPPSSPTHIQIEGFDTVQIRQFEGQKAIPYFTQIFKVGSFAVHYLRI